MHGKKVAAIALMMLGGQVQAQAQEAQLGAAGQPAAGPAAATPLFNGRDLLFLHHMAMHHQQAVDMAALVDGRTDRQEFIRFADYIGRAQAAEIALMSSLLALAEERGLEVPPHAPHGDPPMTSMLSSAQMKELADARGDEFVRLWLEGMIYHHQGGLDMAYAQQEQQLENGRRPYVLDVLVEDIIEVQRAEIIKMRAWLDEWGLEDEP